MRKTGRRALLPGGVCECPATCQPPFGRTVARAPRQGALLDLGLGPALRVRAPKDHSYGNCVASTRQRQYHSAASAGDVASLNPRKDVLSRGYVAMLLLEVREERIRKGAGIGI